MTRSTRCNARSLGTALLSTLLLSTLVLIQSAQAQTISVLYTFQGTPDGAQVYGNLAGDRAGNSYGVTTQGGAFDKGTIFKIDSAGTETILHNFNGDDGSPGYSGLTRDAENNLYGVTLGGGAFGLGTVFKIDSVGNFQTLHSFSGAPDDGSTPYSPIVIRDSAGNLYGTTTNGGTNDLGTVFKLDPAGNLTVLHSFSGTDGSLPTSGLIQDSQGNLYGTAEDGGAFDRGTVFKIDADGNITILHSFTDSEGAGPTTGLTSDAQGNFYGTTVGGGTFGNGTVYKLDPAGTLTVMHSFNASTEGIEPFGRLAQDNAGNLWGTTETEGPLSHGALYKLDMSGHITVYGFPDPAMGAFPFGGMIRDDQGNLYGGTTGGGIGVGTVYKISF
ncbi:MAG TPA: choice-of-anchor tandem repeat GloVer-containing protein [Terriglobales bacterium]|jgi:uncharacterized repeat protein (TIGR03803 family)